MMLQRLISCFIVLLLVSGVWAQRPDLSLRSAGLSKFDVVTQPEEDDEDSKSVAEDDAEESDEEEADDSSEEQDSDEDEDEDEDEDTEETSKTKKRKRGQKKAAPGLAELRIDEKTVSARALNLPIPGSTKTVQDLMDRMKEWADDDDIGAVLLDLGPVGLSMPDLEELRGAMAELSESGKKITAFLNGSNANGYLLATLADEIAIAPTGALEISGIGRLFAFEQGYHQMMGSEFQVITAGKYKYPGFLNRREPDEYFQEEFGAILDSMFDRYVEFIAEGRDLTEDEVHDLIDKALFRADQAQQHGLIDVVSYYDDYRDRLLKRDKLRKYRGDKGSGLDDINSIQDLVEWMNDRMKEAAKDRQAVGPKIAVLHARGPIVDMNLGPAVASQMICRDDFVKVVRSLHKNSSIKAVVLRVDSPGGSGYASDIIWKALRELDDEKPLVVSMGTVAGSGGYYIACPGRKIYAQPTTITGSIGVLGIIESRRSAFNRMDVELSEMKRGEKSLLGAPHRALDEEERAFFQNYISDFYDVFIDRVATGRRRPEAEIREIAEGRIWSGADALELGLVDELGSLDDAIEAAREMANIPRSAELKVVHYPRASSLGELIESLGPLASARTVETLQRASAPSQISFRQQCDLFSQGFQPLCWMAIPDISQPRNAASAQRVLNTLFAPANAATLPWRDN